MELKTGDILCTWHPFEFNKVGLGQLGIRKITGGPDHVAIVVVEESGAISVIDASYTFGKVIKTSLSTWMYIHSGARVEVLRARYSVNETMLKEIAYAQIDKEYDTKTVLWHHLYYQLIKKVHPNFKWQGPTNNGEAADKFYCSELVAYIYDLNPWWNLSTADIYNHEAFIKTRIEFHA